MVEEGLTKQELSELLQYEMPYGRYAGRFLIQIPYEYYSWCLKNHADKGKLGKYMRFLYQAHLDGSIEFLRSNRAVIIRSVEKESGCGF